MHIVFKMMTFILEMTCECGFIQRSWASYINNEMELLVSLLGRWGISYIHPIISNDHQI